MKREPKTNAEPSSQHRCNGISYANIARPKLNTYEQEDQQNKNNDLATIVGKSFAELKAILTQQAELMNSLIKLMTTLVNKLTEK